jgi:antitoxin (DNA-binding transcriptional repressor) of toxin-antitoxin stability system
MERPIVTEMSTARKIKMATVTIKEAQAKLPDLIHTLKPGDELLIVEDGLPVAKLMSQSQNPAIHARPGPGLCKGLITIVADDDEHLRDFTEYMP